MNEKKKKKKSLGAIPVVAVAAVAAGWLAGQLGFGGMGFGLGSGTGTGSGSGTAVYQEHQITNGTENEQGESQAYSAAGYENGEGQGQEQQADDHESDELSLVIMISGDQIKHGDREVSLEELGSILLEYNQPDFIWELWTDQAIKATFDQVKLLLQESAVTYAEIRE